MRVQAITLSVAGLLLLAGCQELPTLPPAGLAPVAELPMETISTDLGGVRAGPVLHRLFMASLRRVAASDGEVAARDLLASVQALRPTDPAAGATPRDRGERGGGAEAMQWEMARIVVDVQGKEPVERLLAVVSDRLRRMEAPAESGVAPPGASRPGMGARLDRLGRLEREARAALRSGDAVTALLGLSRASDMMRTTSATPTRPGRFARPGATALRDSRAGARLEWGGVDRARIAPLLERLRSADRRPRPRSIAPDGAASVRTRLDPRPWGSGDRPAARADGERMTELDQLRPERRARPGTPTEADQPPPASR